MSAFGLGDDWAYRPITLTPTTKIKSKHVVIAAFVIVALIAVTGFALYGRGLGDPNCNCTSPGQAGWNTGSAVGLIIVVLGVLILVWRPDLLVSA